MGVHPIERRAVFLDRDGVINKAFVRDGRPYPPASLSQLEILPGVEEALGRLRKAGFRLIVVTNQPDVARGTQTSEVVEAMHAMLRSRLPLDEVLTCYHDNADRCVCRKPAPGLLLAAAEKYRIDLAASYMVGDRWRDVEAGRRAGCTTLFVDYQYGETEPIQPHVRVDSLTAATDWILAHGQKESS